jgi:hypothetical protein
MKKPLLVAQNALSKLPKPSFENFKTFNERFSIVHDFIVRISIIVIFFTFVNYSLKEMTSNKYILTNIDVSNSLQDSKTMNSGDLKQKIIIDMKKIMGEAKNATHSTSNITNTVSNDAIPLSFGGFDLNQIFLILRKFFHLQNREIRAYIMEEGNNSGENGGEKTEMYKVLLSVGSEAQTEHSFSDRDTVTLFLAENILKYNAPHKLGLYQIIESQDTVKANETIEYLCYLRDKESWWEKLFQDNNWEEKRLHLEAMKKYSYKNYVEAKDFYLDIPNYDTYSEVLLEIAQTNNQINIEYKNKIDELSRINDTLNLKLVQIDSLKNDIRVSYIDSLNRIKQSITTNANTQIKLNQLINSNINQTEKWCNNFINGERGKYLEENEDRKLQKESLKSRALMIFADALSVGRKYVESEKTLTKAIAALPQNDFESNSAIYNWAANIKLSHLEVNIGNNQCEGIIAKAEDFIKKAIVLNQKDGNLYDTYAEILLKKGDINGFYEKLDSALQYPNIPKKITVKDYKKDTRWKDFWKNSKFMEILNRKDRGFGMP